MARIMALPPSTRLEHYEIVRAIEVYRALDTKLNLEVAIKVLPSRLSSDADRVARFEREAQTLAS